MKAKIFQSGLKYTYTLFIFKSWKVVYLQWVFWNAPCMFLRLHFNLTFLTSIEFCKILMQFDIVQGELKLVFRLQSRNEFVKLRAFCDFGPYLLSCLRALRCFVPLRLAHPRALRAYFSTCLNYTSFVPYLRALFTHI